MASPSTADEFLEVVRKSNVLEPRSLAGHVAQWQSTAGSPGSPASLAEGLVRDGLLTTFQAEQLLQGKWRNLIIAGKYKLLDRLGSGGMAAVFLCEHRGLQRRVALKVLPSSQAENPAILERFHREARAAACLDHPNIVKAHDVDQDGKLHFLVMEYVDGPSLEDLVSRQGPMEVPAACQAILQSAEGLQHAHEAGLVHRDIKPANILMDRGGTVKILDMGLARFFHDDRDSLTHQHDSGTILGTADYIAPEQAISSHDVDIRADIYSLGATFYFLLTGSSPFGEGTLAQKFIWHQLRDPRPLRELRDDIPEKLAVVIATMMAKAPEKRYQTPAEVVEALLAFVGAPLPRAEMDTLRECPPTDGGRGATKSGSSSRSTMAPNSAGAIRAGAPPISTLQKPAAIMAATLQSRFGKGTPWSGIAEHTLVLRRRPLFLAVGGGALLCIFGLVLSLWVVTRRSTPPETPELGPEAIASVPPPTPAAPVGKPKEGDGPPPIWTGHTWIVESVVFSPDGRLALSGGWDAAMRLWDTSNGRTVRQFPTGGVHQVIFSPDGVLAASAGLDKKVRLWEVATGQERRCLLDHADGVATVAFTPDGRRLASGGGDFEGNPGHDCVVRLWDVESGKLIRKLEGHTNIVMSMAFTADGRTLLTGSRDCTLRWWDVETGKEIWKFQGLSGPIHGVALSPDGRYAASVGFDKLVRLWDLHTYKEVRRFEGHTSVIAGVTFSADGRLFSVSADGTMRLWDVGSGKELQRFDGPSEGMWGVGVSPDGARALTACVDKTVRLWALPPANETAFVGERARINAPTGFGRVAISRDGRLIAGAGFDGKVYLWDLATRQLLRRLEGHTGPVNFVDFTPDGRRLVSGSFDHTARVWDVETGKELSRFTGHKGVIWTAIFLPGARQVLSAGDDEVACLWDAETGAEVRRLEGHQKSINWVAVSPDGRRGVTASWDQTARVWDMATGKELLCYREHQGQLRSVALAGDGRLAVTTADDGVQRLWDIETGQTVRILEGPAEGYWAVAMSPDGRRVLAGGPGRTVHLWDATTGARLRICGGHTHEITGVACTPDGQTVVSGGLDQTVRVWSLPANLTRPSPSDLSVRQPPMLAPHEMRRYDGHTGPVEAVVLSADGSTAASAGHDRIIHLWDVSGGWLIRNFEGHTGTVQALAFSPDGRYLLSGGADGTVRLWDVASGKEQHRFEGHTGTVQSVAFSVEGRLALSGGADKTLRLWDVEAQRCIRTFTGHSGTIYGVALSADGRLALSGSSDRTIRLWDLDTGREVHCLTGPNDGVTAVAVSPDGERVLSGSWDGTVRLWEVRKGQELRRLHAHTGAVWCVAFAETGSLLVSGGADGTVRVWEAEGGRPVCALEGHGSAVSAIACPFTGRRVLSAGYDRTVRLWDVPR